MDRTGLNLALWQAQRLHRRCGWSLWVGLGLIAATIALVLASMQTSTQVHVLRADASAALTTEAPPRPTETVSAESLAQFYARLPDEAERFALLKRLLLQADDKGVLPPAADYRLVAEPMTRMVRYQLSLPIKGDWSQVQNFVVGALNEMWFLTLDSLLLQREVSDSALVEGRVQFSVLMVRSTPADGMDTASDGGGLHDEEHN